jgi:hypothetical protein
VVADISRDGRLVLFSEVGQGVGARPVTYLRGTDGSPAVRLGTGFALALSPDSARALVATSEGSAAPARARVDIVPTGAGETMRLPTGNLENFLDAHWLPDSRVILHASEPGRGARLYVVTLQGNPVAITPEGIRDWATAPDGETVVAQGADSMLRLYAVRDGEPRDVPGIAGAVLRGWIAAGLLVERRTDLASPRGEVYLVDPLTGRQSPWRNLLPRDPTGVLQMWRVRATPDSRTIIVNTSRALSHLYLVDGLA